jgi:N-acetylmuramoyl-L-alanine amidase
VARAPAPDSTELPTAVVPAVPKKKEPVTPRAASNNDGWTVVIDAGHGGLDPGAIGSRGTFEKDVNLKVAKELAEVLGKNKNFKVVLTRSKDEFLTLAERTHIANKMDADIFVSVHCNSSLSVKSTGFEVYILSPEATDQAAAAVARIENSVVALEAKKGEGSGRLSELLASMAVYGTINESSKVAAYVCRGVRKRSSIDQTSVKEANFHVLRGAQMPGVLVELGYLSHPYSELQLRSSRYLNSLAKGLAEGILMYQQSLGRKKQSITNQFDKPYKRAQK